jgi:hypothetical protein
MLLKAYVTDQSSIKIGLLPSVSEVAAFYATGDVEALISQTTGSESESNIFLTAFENAMETAVEAGWSGKFPKDSTPKVLWIPLLDDLIYAFVLQEEVDGTTYIVSPVELPWLVENE